MARSFPRTRKKPSSFDRFIVPFSVTGMFAVLAWITVDSALIKMTETDCIAGRQAACVELQRRAQ